MNKLSNITNDLPEDKDYQSLLQELQSIINKGKNKAFKTIDNILVETRWQIGERIVREELNNNDRAEYGDVLIKNLAIDLKIKSQRLYEIIRFYKTYPIFRSLSGKLSWKHYTYLISINNEKERKFYEIKTTINSWPTRDLSSYIKNKLYQKTEQKEIDNILKSILPTEVNIEKVFKPDYNLKFIQIAENGKEKELEDKIMLNIESFLKELGSDFALLGRQYPIVIDGKSHFIDIVLYHRAIPCVILVDLKIGKLDSRDIGQMNKYVGYYRKNRQYEHEKDSVGLIICEEAGKEEMAYALDGLEEKIFVAVYKTKLPDDEKIKNAIRKL